jgi:AmmeMemoRadiSam system protein B
LKRSPAVAGQFYHGAATKLTQQVEQYVDRNAKKERAIGVISPHAGLIYSGSVSGEWEIPMGTFQIDEVISHKIAHSVPIVTKDSRAHMFEHSLEVQLPFISYFSHTVKIVPIAMLSASVEECRILGEGIAKAIKNVHYPVVIVASSDMSHYVPDNVAKQKDQKAIDRVLSLDAEGLYETVITERISMCGYLPATVMIFAAKLLGAQSARLIKYATSGEVSGDYDHVVGYAGIILR